MSNPDSFNLHKMTKDMIGFMSEVRVHKHVFIAGASGLYVVAHHYSTEAVMHEDVRRFYKAGLCPHPLKGFMRVDTVERFWEDLVNNVEKLMRFPQALQVLTDNGRAVIVMQNLTTSADTVLKSMDDASLQALYQCPPLNPSA